MEREIIEQKPLSLPEIAIEHIPEDGEVWEGNDGDAHFKLTKHRLDTKAISLSFLSLSVSGVSEERSRVVGEFSEVYGEPFACETMASYPYPIDIAGYYLAEGES